MNNIYLNPSNLVYYPFFQQSKSMSFPKNNWTTCMQSQINSLTTAIVDVQDSDNLSIAVKPPKDNFSFRARPMYKNDSLSFYLNRKRYRNVEKTANLEQQIVPNKQPSSAFHMYSPFTDKPITYISLQSKEDQEEKKKQVIDLDEGDQARKLQKVKKAFFGEHQRQTKLPIVISKRPNLQSQKQSIVLDQQVEPQCIKNKEKRKAAVPRQKINCQREFSDFRKTEKFSGMSRTSDQVWKDYLQKQQQHKQKLKSKKKQVEKSKKQQLKKEDQKKRIQRQNAEYEAVLGGLIQLSPKKKRKMDELTEADSLGNKQILNNIIEDQEQNFEGAKDTYKRSQVRIGAKDNIQFQTSAPNFINMILQHNYGEETMKLETKRIPDFFPDMETYRRTFHYLIANECIADVRHKLKTIQKTDQQYFKVAIQQIDSDTNGEVEISLLQKEGKEKGGIQLKNLSLSRNRLGLICSSKQYRTQYYGVPSKNTKEFAFLVFLNTPTTKDELNQFVRARVKIKADMLQQLLDLRQSKLVHFFDLEKMSTSLREYLAVSNIQCSDLAPSILNPGLVEQGVGKFVQNKDVLNNILAYLKQVFNETQWQSIREMALRQRGFVLLQGPPGTGKTSTLMGLLSAQYQYLKKTKDKRKIMICAPSNAAVDHIAKRILTEGLVGGNGDIIHPNILRTGLLQTMDQNVRSVSLDDQCEKQMLASKLQAEKLSHMSTPQIKQKIIEIQKEIRKLGSKDKESAAKRQELIKYQQMLFKIKSQKYITSKVKYSNFQNQLFAEAEIVLTTLASSGNEKLDKIRGQIACLIVDQAAQATQPNLLIALQTGVEKVLLIGDPYQLPATCISNDSNVTLFNRSLFERFLDANIKPYFLNIQYRMSPVIRAFPSSRFYHDRLIDANTVISRPIPQFLKNFEGRNVLFIDLKYGRDDRRGDSFWNSAQAKLISLLIRCLMDNSVTLGLITPYQSQKRAIFRDCMDSLRGNEMDQSYLQKQIMINTVDSFQGQEKDIIIVSTVRANPKYNVGFLTDERRINVTLTRAKHLLIVIGHADTLGSNQVWDEFLRWTQQRKCYYQITQDKKMQEEVRKVFLELNCSQIRRKKHARLSTDVRNLHRVQIQSGDFQSKREAQFMKFIKQKERQQNQKKQNQRSKQNSSEKQEKTRKTSKYAMNIVDSEKILEEKKKKQEEQLIFQQVLQRMRKRQKQTQDMFK